MRMTLFSRISTEDFSVEPLSDSNFHFVSVEKPNEIKDKITRQRARSHAVKHALEKKRKLQKNNFRVLSVEDYLTDVASKSTPVDKAVVLPFDPCLGQLDPFQSLPVNSARLQRLLTDYTAWQCAEPVFSVSDELSFQSFYNVFRTGLNDPALVNAIMLTFLLAIANGQVDRESLGYQSQAMVCIRERMNSLTLATSISTIGTILLLAGVEARLGMQCKVQFHMQAVSQLLQICRNQGIYLTVGIKRAIFWQDLNSSVMTGSTRVVSHTTFAELDWRRDPFSPSFFQLPPGFSTIEDLGEDFIEILEDLNGLRCIRDSNRCVPQDPLFVANINNYQASVQSRLMELAVESPFMDCCRIGAFLCTSVLCCQIWCAVVIPSHMTSKLLLKLQQTNNDPVWDLHPEILLWLLCVGGSFSPSETVRSGYLNLLRRNSVSRFGGLYSSLSSLHDLLKKFVWAENAFSTQMKGLWRDLHEQRDSADQLNR